MERPLPLIHDAPKVRFYFSPLKGSATIGGGNTQEGKKLFLPTMNVRRRKADVVDAPDFTGAVSLKLEDVLAGLHSDCLKAFANAEEVIKAEPPKTLLGEDNYVFPVERGISFA